ncbi:glutamine--fructose-6-phosphate transaminase (isomerizing) [Anaerofilum sp. An201]|nr:glutamine--fructose-6-phosphate transaminase (isomerizing) [Anaerofilum sp. An201]OUP04839.1 glutamine--fructose-6-phosphate transaminase (isomerizing) [Anaerofilum sp. An201]
MCGIVGYTGFRNAAEVLLDGLRHLEYRGYDSAGIALAGEGPLYVAKTQGKLSALDALLKQNPPPVCGCGIGHTRWATHGAPSDQNSHPHSGRRVTLVHNGIIENYAQLKLFLEKAGRSFSSETDSEVLAQLLDHHYHGDPLEAIRCTLAEVRGSYALAILFEDQPGKIFAARRESPLIVGYGEGEQFVASDIPALLKYTRSYSVLDEGEMAVLENRRVQVFNAFGQPVEKQRLTAEWDMEAAEKGGYPHFMLKEIHEQADALRATVEPRVRGGLPFLDEDGISDELLRRTRQVVLVGCGTAMHAGMVGRQAIESLARIPAHTDIASEFRYRDPLVGPDDLVVIVSQSGETLDTLAALKLAREKGAFTLAVVNVVGSSIARAADAVLYTHAGPEIAVASTKAYSVQLAALYLVALRLALVRRAQSEEAVRGLTEALRGIPALQRPILEECSRVKYLASRYMNSSSLFFMGRQMDYALALEGSLKLKEISYIHSEAYAAGELKHGTISLIEQGTPVVAIATQRHIYEKTLSNVKEARTRGARVLFVCKESAEVPAEVADDVLRLPECDDLLMPLLAILPLQLFAYYMSVLRGCDVDKPRNLAKSVTVE